MYLWLVTTHAIWELWARNYCGQTCEFSVYIYRWPGGLWLIYAAASYHYLFHLMMQRRYLWKKGNPVWICFAFFFAVIVIWFHASVFLVRNVQGEYGNLQISILISLSALAKAGVNFFLMTSGAFVLSSPSTQDIKPFYTKMWKRLCIPAIVCVVIYTILDLFLTLVFSDSGTVDVFMQRFIKGQSGPHLWYMFVLIGLYLMAPAVQHIKELIGFKAFTITAVVLLVISFCGESTAPHYLEWDPGYIMNCLGIFMIGYSLHE